MTRQRRRCGRRPQHRRGALYRHPARRYSGPFEARNADHAAPFVRLSARRLKKTAQRDRLPAQRSISPCPRAAQVAEPDDVDEKLLRRRPFRGGTTSGPITARNGAVHRSSAHARPTGPRSVRAHPSPAGTAATGATHHDRHARTTCHTSSAPRSCRRRSALLPASSRGGRPPCKQHERLVSP